MSEELCRHKQRDRYAYDYEKQDAEEQDQDQDEQRAAELEALGLGNRGAARPPWTSRAVSAEFVAKHRRKVGRGWAASPRSAHRQHQ